MLPLLLALALVPQDTAPTPPAPAPRPYAKALECARKGNLEDAYAWLVKARDSRRVDMTQIDVEPAFEKLRADPRFAALHHGPEIFARPFVEEVKLLHEWDGEGPGDQFGWIARNLGDVDGDGVADLVTSAPTHGAGGSNAGRVYVYSTKSAKQLWIADGEKDEQLGTGVECAGDTNHDGIPDVIASAPGSGRALVWSGRDGKRLLEIRGKPGEDFGRHASGAGDVDGDGFADVIIGAPGPEQGSSLPGRALVCSGKDGHVLLELAGEAPGDRFGSAVAGRSDAHGFLLVVGAPGAGPRHGGRIYVYDRLAARPRFTFDSDETGAALGGMFVALPGDVDADGTQDVFASDWQNAAHGPGTGRVYALSGKDGHVLLTLTGSTPGEGFGTSCSVAGDVDGDGHADLVVGSWQYSGAAVGGGRVELHSGKDGALLAAYTCKTPGDTFGFDAVTLGDTDGDGTSDFLVTSGWSGVKGNHSGRVFVISSGIRRRER